MTPLEKAKAEEGRINYCDECEQFEIVGNAAYCKVDGKLIHPIMMMRGQGTGPAWNCRKRKNPVTNVDKLRQMSDYQLAEWLTFVETKILEKQPKLERAELEADWIEWLKQEVESNG